MTEESATALHKMLTDASKDLIDLEVTSAFRSYDIQEILYAGRAQNVEKESIAKPGHSEHQLGTTIDFSSSEISPSLY